MTRSRTKTKGFTAPSEDRFANDMPPVLVPAPKLRRMLGISAVTLWRWRDSATAEFPTATLINGRLYFSWEEVTAWIAKQQHAT